MAKTGKQIQGDIYRLLKGSTLCSVISGNVYREGCRPRDSRLEDAVVIFTAGLPDQIQTGTVTVNVYVPGIDPYDNGIVIEDGQRCEEIETYAQAWVSDVSESVNTYSFELGSTIHTAWDEDIRQSFVVIKLLYSLFEG